MNNHVNQVEEITQKFLSAFSHLTEEELNWQPNPKTWSIAQNLDHLIIINQSFFPIIKSIRNGSYRTPFLAKIGFIVNAIGNSVVKAVSPNRKNKIKTFAIWEPSKTNLPSGIVNRFAQHQSELTQWMKSNEDLVTQGTVISSPANRFIVYKLEKLMEMIPAHELRHYEQCKEVYDLLQKESFH